MAAALLIATAPAWSQAPAAPSRQALIEDLVTANRILANENVVDGYGHVSVRNPANASRYFLAGFDQHANHSPGHGCGDGLRATAVCRGAPAAQFAWIECVDVKHAPVHRDFACAENRNRVAAPVDQN